MTLVDPAVMGRGSDEGSASRWGAAAFAALALHASPVLWMLWAPASEVLAGPPPAIMLELSPLPEAVAVDADQAAPDEVFAEAAEAAVASKADPEPSPMETETDAAEEATPAETAVAAEAETVEETLDAPTTAAAEMALPPTRPKPAEIAEPKKRPPRKRPERPAPSTASEASKAAEQASARVQRSSRTAAADSADGASGMSPATWRARLMAHLERKKVYPSEAKARGETGVAYVRFRIDGSGNVLSATLARSSGHLELDQATLALVRNASPVPPPPAEANRTITAPVAFSLR
ncbi:MAG TPA: energy transducer TonB [Hansschlegelia sp.]